MSQLCISTERFECLIHVLELRRGFFLSLTLSDTPHYENVPFEVPGNWVWTTLEEICLFLSRGKSPKYSDTDKTYPVFAQKCNLKEGGISLEQARFLDPSTICKWSEEYKLKTGDVLVNSTGTGTVGRTRLFHESYLKNYLFVVPDSHVSVIRTTSEVKSEFVFAYISSQLIQQYLEDNLAGSTNQKELYIGVLSDLSFPLPPLTEQQRIVVEIKKWFELIDQIEQGKTDLQAVIKQTKSKILDLAIHGKLVPQDLNDEPASELLKRINPDFTPCDNGHYAQLPQGWCYSTIKDIFIINPKTKADNNIEAGFVPMANITDGYNSIFKYETKQWSKIKTGFTHFADGDIAVAKISPCLENRKSVVLKGLPNGIGAGTTELHIFRSQLVNVQFALCFFKSEYFINQCVGSFNGVVGQQRVSKNIIENMIIAIPPINEQKRIVYAIRKIFAQLDTIKESL